MKNNEITSNFYIKDSKGRPVEIEDDNIFTVCPICDREFNITLETFSNVTNASDVYSVSVYCPECVEIRRKTANGNR